MPNSKIRSNALLINYWQNGRNLRRSFCDIRTNGAPVVR